LYEIGETPKQHIPEYHPVVGQKLLDGVFVPQSGPHAVILDSAGHTFNGFPHIDGVVFGSIWPRAADLRSLPSDIANNADNWIYAIGSGERYMPEHRGLLGLHPNAGITVSLEAIRKVYPEIRPVRFRATAALVDAPDNYPNKSFINNLADVWIFVDGRLVVKHLRMRPKDDILSVNVKIGSGDRFLTIVSTDGGDGASRDWVVLGDPVLDVRNVADALPPSGGGEHQENSATPKGSN
jgi:hypothetical protein